MINNYVIDENYYDYETGRRKVAVLCSTTRCYYFPIRHGKKAAIALCNRLNNAERDKAEK